MTVYQFFHPSFLYLSYHQWEFYLSLLYIFLYPLVSLCSLHQSSKKCKKSNNTKYGKNMEKCNLFYTMVMQMQICTPAQEISG